MANESIIFLDELTGIYNRRYLSQLLPEQMERAKKERFSVWFFMMDLDNFKQINDNLGHLKGDEVLKSTAEILKRNLRSEDYLVRYAGDEFSAILPGGTLSDALAVAKRLLDSVEKAPFNLSLNAALKLSISIGVSCFPDDATESLRLIDLADKALYVSKGKGKNHVSVVSDVEPEVLSVYQILERFPCPVFINKEEEIGKVNNLIEASISAKKQKNILFIGESGVGKTTLLKEIWRIVAAKKIQLISGRFLETNVLSDYRALTEGLVKYFEEYGFDGAFLTGISPAEQQIFTEFIPGLKKIIQISPASSGQQIKTTDKDIASIFARVLINISKNKPLCLVFDDFQWVDKATLEVERALKDSPNPVIFLSTINKQYLSAPDKTLPIADYAAKRDIDFDLIDVKPFNLEQASKMVLAVFKEFDNIQDFSNLILGVTKGNPLFIEELLKFFINRGFIFYRKGKWGWLDIRNEDIPKSIDEVVAERLKSLSPDIKEIIMQASVIGENFEVNLLQKLGKKNQGYVMDLIDSAKKSGLIKEDHNVKGDSFGFTSTKIRDVLFGLADNRSVKDLNRQIGQIQEEIFKGREKQIAGELYYRFKKADDEKKTAVYSRMIKEGRTFVYEQSINFAEKILKEKDFDVRFLSDESQDLISDFVRLIYIAQVNSGLYPKNSAMRTEPVLEAFSKLSRIFEYTPAISLGRFNDFFIVNNKIFERPTLKQSFQDSFTAFLKQNKIEKIVFQKGLTKDELERFFEVFSTSDKEPLEKKFNQNSFERIQMVFISYEDYFGASKIKEREQLQDIMLIDYIMGKLPGSDVKNASQLLGKMETHSEDIASALTKIADRVSREKGIDADSARGEFLADGFQKIARHVFNKGEGEWLKYKKGLAKTIISLEPDLRSEVLRSEVISDEFMPSGAENSAEDENNAASTEKKNIMRDILSEVPDDVIVDMIVKEHKDHKTSGPELKKIISKFVPEGSERKDELLNKIRDSLKVNEEATEEEIKFLTTEEKWKSLGIEDKIAEFLKMTGERYVNISQQFGFKSFIEVVLSGEDAKSNLVIKRFFDFLADKDPAVKKAAIKDILELVDAVFADRKPGLFETLFSEFIAAFKNENEKEIIDTISAGLEKFIFVALSGDNFILFKKVFTEIKKISAVSQDLPKDKLDIINNLLQEFLSENVLKRIVEKFLEFIDNNKDYAEIAGVLTAIGDPVIPYLVEEAMLENNIGFVGYFAGYLRRKTVAGILVGMSKEAVITELKKKLYDNRWFVARNAMDLIMHTNNQEFFVLLDLVGKHSDARIRRKLIFILGRINYKGTLNICYELCRDEDENVCIGALRIIGEKGNNDSIGILEKLNLKGPAVQARASAIEEIKNRMRK